MPSRSATYRRNSPPPPPPIKKLSTTRRRTQKHVHDERSSCFRDVTCFNKTLSLSPPISPPTHHLPSQFGGDQSAGLTVPIVLLRSFLPRSASAVRGFDETAVVVYVFSLCCCCCCYVAVFFWMTSLSLLRLFQRVFFFGEVGINVAKFVG